MLLTSVLLSRGKMSDARFLLEQGKTTHTALLITKYYYSKYVFLLINTYFFYSARKFSQIYCVTYYDVSYFISNGIKARLFHTNAYVTTA